MDECEQALQDAVKGYLLREFGQDSVDFEDVPSDVGLLYTTVDDYNYREHDLQVSADTVNHSLHYYLDGARFHISQFASTASMWAFMDGIDFQTLYEIAMSYVRQYDPTIK